MVYAGAYSRRHGLCTERLSLASQERPLLTLCLFVLLHLIDDFSSIKLISLCCRRGQIEPGDWTKLLIWIQISERRKHSGLLTFFSTMEKISFDLTELKDIRLRCCNLQCRVGSRRNALIRTIRRSTNSPRAYRSLNTRWITQNGWRRAMETSWCCFSSRATRPRTLRTRTWLMRSLRYNMSMTRSVMRSTDDKTWRIPLCWL